MESSYSGSFLLIEIENNTSFPRPSNLSKRLFTNIKTRVLRLDFYSYKNQGTEKNQCSDIFRIDKKILLLKNKIIFCFR